MPSAMLSSIGQKVLMSLTGLVMFGFVIGHLLGNLALLTGDADTYNQYSHFLLSLGALLILIELVLLGSLLVHVWAAISIIRGKRIARPERYRRLRSAGGKSKKTLASSSMIFTGFLLLVFLIVHLKTFKFGPAEAEGYVAIVDGVEMRDLYTLVIHKFQQPVWVVGYVIAMVVLGIHLSHAFWSAFQSLGFYHERYTQLLYVAGRVIAFVISAGFVFIPLWIFFSGTS